MAVWLAGGLIAATLIHYGLTTGSDVPIYLAGGAVLVAFIGHVIANAVYETAFTRRELVLALVLYGVSLVAYLIAALVDPAFKTRFFLPGGLALAGVGIGVFFYMVTHYGMRDVFESFNVVRDAAVHERGERPQKRWRSRQ